MGLTKETIFVMVLLTYPMEYDHLTIDWAFVTASFAIALGKLVFSEMSFKSVFSLDESRGIGISDLGAHAFLKSLHFMNTDAPRAQNPG